MAFFLSGSFDDQVIPQIHCNVPPTKPAPADSSSLD
jgi:hypothetical protein